jgi:putative hydrolase of the HAD superfamily
VSDSSARPSRRFPDTFRPDAVDAAVFDIGGVFTYPDYAPVESRLTELSVDPPSDLDAYRRAHHAGVRALSDSGRPTDEAAVDFWNLYDRAYGTSLGVPDPLIDSLRIAMRATWGWVHQPNVAAFHRLATTGLPLAIVSNNDGTAPEQMRDYGVCQVGPGPLPSVAAIVDSTLEGVAKPDPAIFKPALDALGIEPSRVLYVGDTVHADVAGAGAAGMQVVQLDPFGHHTDHDHARMTDLDQLTDVLTGAAPWT